MKKEGAYTESLSWKNYWLFPYSRPTVQHTTILSLDQGGWCAQGYIMWDHNNVFVHLRKQPPCVQELPVLSTSTCVRDAPIGRNFSGTTRDFGMQLTFPWSLEPVITLINTVHLRVYCLGPPLQNLPNTLTAAHIAQDQFTSLVSTITMPLASPWRSGWA